MLGMWPQSRVPFICADELFHDKLSWNWGLKSHLEIHVVPLSGSIWCCSRQIRVTSRITRLFSALSTSGRCSKLALKQVSTFGIGPWSVNKLVKFNHFIAVLENFTSNCRQVENFSLILLFLNKINYVIAKWGKIFEFPHFDTNSLCDIFV